MGCFENNKNSKKTPALYFNVKTGHQKKQYVTNDLKLKPPHIVTMTSGGK